jgi:hypothetical protein
MTSAVPAMKAIFPMNICASMHAMPPMASIIMPPFPLSFLPLPKTGESVRNFFMVCWCSLTFVERWRHVELDDPRLEEVFDFGVEDVAQGQVARGSILGEEVVAGVEAEGGVARDFHYVEEHEGLLGGHGVVEGGEGALLQAQTGVVLAEALAEGQQTAEGVFVDGGGGAVQEQQYQGYEHFASVFALGLIWKTGDFVLYEAWNYKAWRVFRRNNLTNLNEVHTYLRKKLGDMLCRFGATSLFTT